MSGFRKWPSIGTFARVELDGMDIAYRAKVKLHGTNAAIRIDPDGTVTAQSRSRDITPEDDNAGFAAWVAELDRGVSLCPLQCVAEDHGTVVIYGEWCGPGIQKGSAINRIPHRIFAVFAVYVDGFYEVDPGEIDLLIGGSDDLIPIPWHTGLMQTSDRQAFADDVTAIVDVVDKVCPFTLDAFGIAGPGEGVVMYPHTTDGTPLSDPESVGRMMFKAKGETHRHKRSEGACKVQQETPASVLAFVDDYVTDARCSEVAFAVDGGQRDVRKTGAFLKALCGDVIKESAADLALAELTWKDVGRAVNSAAGRWYRREAGA